MISYNKTINYYFQLNYIAISRVILEGIVIKLFIFVFSKITI